MTPQTNRSSGLLPALYRGGASIELAGQRLTGEDLAAAVGGVASSVAGARRVAIVAHPNVATLVTVAGVLAAGGTAIPLAPSAGMFERDHILRDAEADLVLDGVDLAVRDTLPLEPPVDDSPGLVLYTSGSTGAPKGAVISRRAVATNLDTIADLWEWNAGDVLAHALPLFHVHGLVFGGLGPLRIGSPLIHTGRYFTPAPSASIYFGVPSMWASLSTSDLHALASARLLVSGAGPLPQRVFDRIVRLTGQRVLNRYAMTETLIIASPRPADVRSPQSVGRPLPGVEVRLAEVEDAVLVTENGWEAGGNGSGRGGGNGSNQLAEVQVRSASMFSGYLGRSPALDNVGWFSTGDLGEWLEDGSLRLVGRKDTDLIKTGGYRVGAGEVEDALLAHPSVAEAAVAGLPDDKLGQRIAAWVVVSRRVDRAEVASFLAARLAPYKQPQAIYIADSLPRNALGKVQKRYLLPDGTRAKTSRDGEDL